jgi:membrane fusion protein (multidrug efflux system)
MKKNVIYILIAVAAVLFIIWKLGANKKENEKQVAVVKESTSGAVPVIIEPASLSTFEPVFDANGNFQADQQINFSAEYAGRVTSLLVKEGSVVSKGQVLAQIDNQVASADLQNAEASVNAAKTDMERFQKALQSGGVTQKQVDDMKVQYQAANARLALAKKNASNTSLRSPINGIINAKFIEVGSYLAAGTKLFEIVNINKLKLVVNVPEMVVVQLKNGDLVDVTTNVYPEEVYKGKITFIAAKGDETLNYPVEIEITNISGKQLKAGMYGSAKFNLPNKSAALLISRAAFFGGLSNNQIFVEEGGKAKLKSVTTGNVYGDKVEVRSGLAEGEKVIISGQVNLVDGTEVMASK